MAVFLINATISEHKYRNVWKNGTSHHVGQPDRNHLTQQIIRPSMNQALPTLSKAQFYPKSLLFTLEHMYAYTGVAPESLAPDTQNHLRRRKL